MNGAILFDFNGVLVDDEEQHRLAFTHVLEGIRLPLPKADYYAHYLGFDDQHCFAEAFRRSNRTLPTQLLRHLVGEKAALYRELIDRDLTFVPGAVEFVRAAAAEFRLGIVSGALRAEIDLALDGAGLADRFETIVAGADVPRGKPDPAGYRAALAALAARRPLDPAGCIAVEDSRPGLEAARAAGLRVLALTTSRPAADFPDAAAVWPSFADRRPADIQALLDR